jgi:hypothetical protein
MAELTECKENNNKKVGVELGARGYLLGCS